MKQTIPNDQIGNLIQKCAEVGNITVEQMVMQTRVMEVVKYRQLAMAFLNAYTDLSLAAIGGMLGGKDHATVLHAVRNVKNFVEIDRKYRETYQVIDDYARNLLSGVAPAVDDPMKKLQRKISILEQTVYEQASLIQELALKLRAAEGQARILKSKMERERIPSHILTGE
jgi:hypothetical protein